MKNVQLWEQLLILPLQQGKSLLKLVWLVPNIRSMQCCIHRCKHLKRKKFVQKPPLTKKHKEVRLQFAENHIHWGKKWRKGIFTDEKRFNLYGPDRTRYYFHDLRKEEQILSRNQMGEGGVILWSAIGYYGKAEIVFINGTLNRQRYICTTYRRTNKQVCNDNCWWTIHCSAGQCGCSYGKACKGLL